MRIAIALAFATACTGTISTGTGDDDDAPPPPVIDVQMTVHDGATPVAGASVVFQASDGTLIAEATTDSAGLAKADMPNGGSVTVIRHYPATINGAVPDDVYTYVAVKAGDRLQLGREVDDLGTPTAIVVKVPDAAQGTVKVTTPCGSGQGTAPNIAVTISGCPTGDVTFYVEDGNRSAFAAKATVAPNVDLSLQTLTGSLSTSLSALNVGPDITAVDVEARVMAGSFAMYSSGPKRVDGTPQTVNLPNLQNVEELIVATIQSNAGTQMIGSRKAYAVTPTSVDATAGLIPYVGNTQTTPTTITWTETGTGTADVVVTTLDVTRGGAQTGTEYIRTIIAPHTGPSLTIPVLVGANAIYNPTMQDQIATRFAIAAGTGGYDALRATAFTYTNLVEVAKMNGGVTLSYDGNDPPAL